jgi:glycosyltransferase involved in cell wall biosynthesis
MHSDKDSKDRAPLISIIMSVRNGADTIKETIESVIAQTYQNWELLIRDNSSTDGTAEIIKSFGDTRINLTVNENDKGSFFNLLLFTAAAKGEYIKAIDDDSYLYPECLEKQVQLLIKRTDIAMVTCDTEYRTPSGKIIAAKIPFADDVVTRDDYIKYTLATARGSVQEGNQLFTRTEFYRYAVDKMMSIGCTSGLINAYSPYFFIPAAILSKGNMFVIRETLSSGIIEANSYSMKLNQAKLMPDWIKLLRLDGYKINPLIYVWARIMIIARSTTRWFAFKLLGRS